MEASPKQERSHNIRDTATCHNIHNFGDGFSCSVCPVGCNSFDDCLGVFWPQLRWAWSGSLLEVGDLLDHLGLGEVHLRGLGLLLERGSVCAAAGCLALIWLRVALLFWASPEEQRDWRALVYWPSWASCKALLVFTSSCLVLGVGLLSS